MEQETDFHYNSILMESIIMDSLKTISIMEKDSISGMSFNISLANSMKDKKSGVG